MKKSLVVNKDPGLLVSKLKDLLLNKAITRKTIILNGKEQVVQKDIGNYITALDGKNIKALQPLTVYADIGFKKNLNQEIAIGHIFSAKLIVWSKSGTPRLKIQGGYVTANKKYVQLTDEAIIPRKMVINDIEQIVRDDIENYITSLDEKNIKMLVDQPVYKDTSFKVKTTKNVEKGTVIAGLDVVWSKGGTPRFKVKSGYVTTNKKYVVLTDEPITPNTIILNGKKQIVRDDIENYIISLDGRNIRILVDQPIYQDTSFKIKTTQYVKKDAVIAGFEVVLSKGGTPRFKVKGGYLTTNKKYVELTNDKLTPQILMIHGKEQLVCGDIENYIIDTENKHIKFLSEQAVYRDISLKIKTNQIAEKDSVFLVIETLFDNNGIPCFKVKDGYLTANKEYVELTEDAETPKKIIINDKVQIVRDDIENYLIHLGEKAIEALSTLRVYADLGFKNPTEYEIKKGQVFMPLSVEWSKGGTPRFKVKHGYVTTNKKSVQLTDEEVTGRYLVLEGKTQLVCDDIENYLVEIGSNENIEVLRNIALYKDRGFQHKVDTIIPKGSIFKPQGVEFTGGGTPRIVVYGGYITANKKFVTTTIQETNLEIDITNNSSNTLNLSHVNPDLEYQYFYYCGEAPVSGEIHMNSWLPIFLEYTQNYNLNFIVVLRNFGTYKWIVENYPEVNVVYGKRSVDVEAIVNEFPQIRLCLYSSSLPNNLNLIRLSHIHHAFIGHGDSDKTSSVHKGLRFFDEIWTAGQAHIDRFGNDKLVDYSLLTYKKVGRPNLKHKLLLSNGRIALQDKVSLLYLPTWEGVFQSTEYFSVPIAEEFISELIARFGLDVGAKFHPFTGGREPQYRENILGIEERNPFLHIHRAEENLEDIISAYDIFICDISSVVTDCLSLNRPIFLYLPKDKDIDIMPSNMTYDDYCYVFSTVQELLEKMQQVLSGNDYLAENRTKAVDYFLGLEETKNDAMAHEILAAVNRYHTL